MFLPRALQVNPQQHVAYATKDHQHHSWTSDKVAIPEYPLFHPSLITGAVPHPGSDGSPAIATPRSASRRIMDGPHYPANVINTSSASYPSQSAITPHQLQHQGAPIQQHTLPPLHQNNPAMQQPYGSYPHTPRTPATPNTPGSANTMPNYPPPPQQNAGRGGYQMMPNNPYQQGHQQYTSSAMLPPASTASAQPQGLAAAPNQGGRVPPVLRPMPAGGMMAPQPGLNSPYAQSPMMQQPPVVQDAEQPTHVVGSQGRRGVLPSAPGRPQAITTSNPAAKNQIPQKDADGKFPCPHCTKTYLHAKHLKRHLLRRKCIHSTSGSDSL